MMVSDVAFVQALRADEMTFTVASPKEVVVAAWRTFSTRDPSRIEACFTKDAVWLVPFRNATALALGDHETRGMDRQQIAHFIANDFGRIFVADVKVDVLRLFGDGDVVILEQRTRATLANGRSYCNDYCFIIKVRDGRIALIREYMDTLSGFRQVFGEEAVKPVEPIVRPARTAR
ncbi:MAG TPA: nuclear transport factor 2 family protein [Vicinamibacterales bacterium]|jgi:ketosteroid isomerase-like protein|nr:nuclear transport factor 2 family protein [Vicinamibacterales bacterium]